MLNCFKLKHFPTSIYTRELMSFSRGLIVRESDSWSKGCEFESVGIVGGRSECTALTTPNTTTEVPLSKALNPQLLPGCPLLRCVITVCVCVCVCVFSAVCVHCSGVCSRCVCSLLRCVCVCVCVHCSGVCSRCVCSLLRCVITVCVCVCVQCCVCALWVG